MRSARPVLLAIACLALLAPTATAQDLPELPDLDEPAAGITPTIKTVGDSSITARNDTARVSFAMVARRRTGPAALAVSARKARRVIARLRAGGVEAGDIRTLTVRLTRYRKKGRVLYAIARNSIRVTVRDVGRVGPLIDSAVSAGATGVDGPSFFLSDPKALYQRALLEAFDDARAKAEALADRAGVMLGTPMTITEGIDVGSFDGGGQGQSDEGLVRSPTPTRPGRSTVNATVTVVFALDEF